MLADGEIPGRDIYLVHVNMAGTPVWTRKFGLPGNDEYLFPGSQSQIVQIGSDIFFLGIRNDGASEDALLVRTVSTPPAIENCVEDALIFPIDHPNTRVVPWTPNPTGQLAVTTTAPDLHAPLSQGIICSACFAAGNPDYTLQFTASPPPLTGYNLWPDKVFIGDNVTVTIQNGTLDITQADVVFGKCARIVVGPGGHIRANNSTFRPCIEIDTWYGIYFEQSAITGSANGSGFFNECVFKNMTDGIYVNQFPVLGASRNFEVRLTDNSFINNYFSVRTNNCVMNDPITGNTFMVDTRGIDYTLCGTLPAYNPVVPLHYGIAATTTTFEGAVSQNDFVNTLDFTSTLSLIGISMLGCTEANVTLNDFTNNRIAVEMIRCNNIAVENNRMEVTQQYDANQNQIFCDISEFIWITGNHLVNSFENYTTGLIVAAIYHEDSRFINVKENTVEGFIAGIQVLRTTGICQVTENKISNCNLVGIWVENGAAIDVSCNEIKLRRRDPATTIGIRFGLTTPGPTTTQQFRGNCIFNTSSAMVFDNTTGAAAILPLVRNNYLYNYTLNGVLSNNYNGNIGTSNALGGWTLAGRNTFTSNNFPTGAMDVRSIGGVLIVQGNWGIRNVVGVFPPNVATQPFRFHSTAPCGHQLDPTTTTQDLQQWLVVDQCDRFQNNLTVFIPNIANGNFDQFGGLQDSGPDPGMARMALFEVLGIYGEDVALPFHDFLMAGQLLSDHEKAELHLEWLISTSQWQAALQQLAAVGGKPDYNGFLQLERLRLTLLAEGRDWNALRAEELELLEGLAVETGTHADVARGFLNLVRGGLPYIHEPIVMPTMPGNDPAYLVATDRDNMEIFPNPSESVVNIKFFMESEEAPLLRVTDLVGRTVLEQQLYQSAGNFSLDISNYQQGSYVISLVNPQGKSLYKNLVKL